MKTIIQSVEKVQIGLGIFFLLVFFLATLLQILTRFMGWSVIWTEELANYSFIWAIFMGAAVMVNRKEHFTFDFLQMKLPRKMKLYLDIFIDVLLLAFNIVLLVYGVVILSHFWHYTWETLPFLKKGYVWLSLPVMSATMLLYSFGHIGRAFGYLRNLNGKGLDS